MPAASRTPESGRRPDGGAFISSLESAASRVVSPGDI